MKKNVLSFMLILIGLAGCSRDYIPQRSLDFEKPREVVRSYYDYRRLEQAGVETVTIKSQYFTRRVSLSQYLYLIAMAFEDFGKEADAKKLYLHLLIHYPVINEGSQLGVMTENRLRWLLGDKSWVLASVDELILRLERALCQQDVQALARLISRDFGFGRNYDERYAVKYQDGIKLISGELSGLRRPVVEVVSKIEDENVLLKTTGWEQGKKIWYFSLQKNQRMQGWEWDLAYWERDPSQ